MKAWEKKIAPLGFALAGVLFLFAAVVPAVRGDSLNAAFFGVGILFLILGVALWRGSTKDPSQPS